MNNIPINTQNDAEESSFVNSASVAETTSAKGATSEDKLSAGGRFFDYVLKAALFLAVFLVPLFYFFSSDPIGLSKNLLLTTLSLIVLLSWVGKIISFGSFQFRKTWILWPAVALGIVVLASNFFSPSFWPSFLGDIGRHSFSTVAVLSYLILFLAALENIGRRDAFWLMLAMIASATLAAIVSLLQFLGIFILPGGQFTNNSLFTPLGTVFSLSLFVALILPIVVELFTAAARPRLRTFWGLLGLLMLFIIMLVNFRVVWLVLAIGFLFYLGMVSFKQGFFSSDWARQKRIIVPLLIMAVAILFWLLPNILGPRLTNIPAQISPSYQASLQIIKGTWGDSFKNALLGSGPETFPISYAKHKSAALNQTNFWGLNFNDANAEVLTWLTNQGLLGGLAWLFFVVGFLIITFRILRKGTLPLGAMGLLAGWILILASKFFYSTPVSVEIFFWMLPALFLIRVDNLDESLTLRWYHFKAGSRVTLVAFIVSVVVLVLSTGGLYLSIQRWLAERSYAKILLTESTNETRDELIRDVTNAIALNQYEARYFRSFTRIGLAKINDVVAGVNQRPPDQRQLTPEETAQVQNLTVRVFSALQRAQQLDPENTGLLVDVAEGYKGMSAYVGGANDLAITVYEQAVELESINPFLRSQLAQLYLVKENFFSDQLVRDTVLVKQAEEQLLRAIELNPNYSNARYFMGFILDRRGELAGALEQFQRVLTLNPQNQVIQLIVRNLQSGLTALGPPPPPEPETPPVVPEEAQGLPQ